MGCDVLALQAKPGMRHPAFSPRLNRAQQDTIAQAQAHRVNEQAGKC